MTTEKQTNKCYSENGEDFHEDSYLDVIENNELQVGDTYYSGDAVRPEPIDLIDIDCLLEGMAEQAYDIGGEYAEDYPDIDQEGRAELRAILKAWADKHAAPTFFTVENIVEHIVTQEDLNDI